MLRDQPSPVLPDPIDSSLPRIWLFTDQRNDESLEQTIKRLPRGSGIIFRHYHLDESSRRARFETVRKLARRRGHIVFLAGSHALATLWRADGVHGRGACQSGAGRMRHSAPVHNAREIHQANRAGAEIFFLSPVFRTSSHPGQRPLNPAQVRRLAALCNGAVILLGGMDRHRYHARKNHLTHGWAAIDAFN
ncbi:MAG: thiamine phosphate synthase [Parasphingorhabdus sp.]